MDAHSIGSGITDQRCMEMANLKTSQFCVKAQRRSQRSSPSPPWTVDVVIPVRDGAKTILQALDSVLRQTEPPTRIIVVDDCSQDDTAHIVAAADNSLIQLVSTPPFGISHARNVGIEASRAELIAFLDSDDRWHPDK